MPEVGLTNEEIRRAYFQVMSLFKGNGEYGKRKIPRWDGGVDKYGRHYKCVWERIKKFLEAHNCDDVYGFIWANVSAVGPKCYPTMLYNDSAWDRYIEYKISAENQVIQQYRTNYVMFRTLLAKLLERTSPESAVLIIVKDPTVGLSPLFKVIVAETFGISPLEVPESVYNAAAFQYLKAKGFYDRHWPKSKWINCRLNEDTDADD